MRQWAPLFLAFAVSACMSDVTFDPPSGGQAVALKFTAQPDRLIAGRAHSFSVAWLDAFGQVVDTGATIALADASGSLGIHGSLERAAVHGVATFDDISLDHAIKSATLSASGAGVAPIVSASFDIVAIATRLRFATAPRRFALGTSSMQELAVVAEDDLGNLDADAAGHVQISLEGAQSATLSGDLEAALVDGVATFTGFGVDETANGLSLRAHASGLADALSAPFDVYIPWVHVLDGIESGGAVRGIAVDPMNPKRVYAGAGNKVLRSSDGGMTWSAGAGLQTTEVWSVYLDGAHAAVYAGTDNGVWRSLDQGLTWEPSNLGLQNMKVFSMTSLKSQPSIMYASGVYPTTVAVSHDGGYTWSALANPDAATQVVYDLAIDPAAPLTLYAAAQSGTYKSTDGGYTWQPLPVGSHGSRAVRIDPSDSRRVYVGSITEGLFISEDAGLLWAPRGSLVPNAIVRSIAIDPTATDTLYVSILDGGVYKSFNRGKDFVGASSGVASAYTRTIAMDPSDPSILYLAADADGIYKTATGAL